MRRVKSSRGPRPRRPIVIAHRGASGHRPEHTLAAYELAIDMGADFVEPDLVMTRDGRLVARHDNLLDATTDVARRAEFASLRTSRSVDGVALEGWFSEDFTLEQLRTLRAVERIPGLRPANAQHDGRWPVPTLEEVIDLVRRKERETGRRIGIYPETKHPSHFAARGLAMEDTLVATLHAAGYRGRDAAVFLQCFEIASLRRMASSTDLPCVQLLGDEGGPFDEVLAGRATSYDDMATPHGLAAISEYAAAVGPNKGRVVPRDAHGALDPARATRFARDAHDAGLLVHAWTFRAENAYVPSNLRSSDDPRAQGDAAREMRVFFEAGVDGVFTDHPDLGVAARDAFLAGGAR
jgi:glycerophosphoryl diester phosphodiesterase